MKHISYKIIHIFVWLNIKNTYHENKIIVFSDIIIIS